MHLIIERSGAEEFEEDALRFPFVLASAFALLVQDGIMLGVCCGG